MWQKDNLNEMRNVLAETLQRLPEDIAAAVARTPPAGAARDNDKTGRRTPHAPDLGDLAGSFRELFRPVGVLGREFGGLLTVVRTFKVGLDGLARGLDFAQRFPSLSRTAAQQTRAFSPTGQPAHAGRGAPGAAETTRAAVSARAAEAMQLRPMRPAGLPTTSAGAAAIAEAIRSAQARPRPTAPATSGAPAPTTGALSPATAALFVRRGLVPLTGRAAETPPSLPPVPSTDELRRRHAALGRLEAGVRDPVYIGRSIKEAWDARVPTPAGVVAAAARLRAGPPKPPGPLTGKDLLEGFYPADPVQAALGRSAGVGRVRVALGAKVADRLARSPLLARLQGIAGDRGPVELDIPVRPQLPLKQLPPGQGKKLADILQHYDAMGARGGLGARAAQAGARRAVEAALQGRLKTPTVSTMVGRLRGLPPVEPPDPTTWRQRLLYYRQGTRVAVQGGAQALGTLAAGAVSRVPGAGAALAVARGAVATLPAAAGAATGVATLAAAAVTATVALKRLAEHAHESRRPLQEYSGPIAATMAQFDLRAYRRNMAFARDMTADTKALAESVSQMQDSLQPHRLLWGRLKGAAGQGAAGFVDQMAKNTAGFADALNQNAQGGPGKPSWGQKADAFGRAWADSFADWKGYIPGYNMYNLYQNYQRYLNQPPPQQPPQMNPFTQWMLNIHNGPMRPKNLSGKP